MRSGTGNRAGQVGSKGSHSNSLRGYICINIRNESQSHGKCGGGISHA